MALNLTQASVGLFTAAVLVAAACGKKSSKNDGGDDKTQQITMSGQLALGAASSFAGTSSPNTVYALPASVIENIYSFDKNVIKTFPIGTDGKFSASVDTSKGDVLLVAVDSTAANRLDGIRGVLSLKDDSGSLMRLPAKEAKQAVDLGTMTADSSGKEYVSGKTTDNVQSSFSLALAQMKELARTDDNSRQLINVVANIKDNGDYFFVKPYATFKSNLSLIKNTSVAPASISYNGYGLYFIGKWTGLRPEDFCNGASAAAKITLTPPANVTPKLCDGACNASSPVFTTLSNSGTGAMTSEGGDRSSCASPHGSTDGQFYIAKENRGGDTSFLGFNWGGGGYDGAMPPGTWVLSLNGSEVGRYDLKSADPVNAAGKIVIYVPSVKAVVDSNNKVTTVEVEWYLWNSATSSYEKVTDTTAFARNVNDGGVEMADYTGGCSQRVVFTPFQNVNSFPMSVDYSARGAAFPPTNNTQTPNAETVCEAESIAVGYSMNGVSYRFDFRPYY
ncbi:MAG: hypothetical protein EBR09_15110 [Proteobacteria bacterium]|nr:hypothetical protein [Pseudomonadota bacterium]